MKSFEEVDYMLIAEYVMLMKANSLKKLDREREIYLQAYMDNVATGTKQVGKKTVPLYPQFKDLFDFDKYEQEILGKKTVEQDKNSKLKELVLKANKKGG